MEKVEHVGETRYVMGTKKKSQEIGRKVSSNDSKEHENEENERTKNFHSGFFFVDFYLECGC